MCGRVNMNVYVNKFFKYYYININEQILRCMGKNFLLFCKLFFIVNLNRFFNFDRERW